MWLTFSSCLEWAFSNSKGIEFEFTGNIYNYSLYHLDLYFIRQHFLIPSVVIVGVVHFSPFLSPFSAYHGNWLFFFYVTFVFLKILIIYSYYILRLCSFPILNEVCLFPLLPLDRYVISVLLLSIAVNFLFYMQIIKVLSNFITSLQSILFLCSILWLKLAF